MFNVTKVSGISKYGLTASNTCCRLPVGSVGNLVEVYRIVVDHLNGYIPRNLKGFEIRVRGQ